MSELQIHDFDLLRSYLDEKKYSDFIHLIDEWNPVSAADFLSTLPPEQLPVVFRLLKKNTAASVFAQLETDEQASLIQGMSDKQILSVIDEMFMDDAVDLLEELPAGMVTRLMQTCPTEMRNEINRFLSYPEDSAGSVMTSEYIDLKKHMTCAQAIDRIRQVGEEKETVYVAYVTDSARILEGVVPLKKLLFADPETKIEEIMDTHVIYASTHDDRESVAQQISHYGILAIPVVDKEKRLVGLVTVDDALEVLESETTEDIEIMAAIVPSDKPYMKTSVFETWKKRIPWLLLLMISATFTSTIITHYEAAISTYAILTAFFPMLMDTGGNAGSQTSVTVIRGLSLGEIEPKNVFRILWKEFRVSVLCGLTLAAVTFVKVMVVDFHFQASVILENGTTQNNLLIAAIISITVFLAVIIAKAVGTLLPLGAKKIGLDPAVMASPFITTIVDTVILFLYFSVASALLGGF